MQCADTASAGLRLFGSRRSATCSQDMGLTVPNCEEAVADCEACGCSNALRTSACDRRAFRRLKAVCPAEAAERRTRNDHDDPEDREDPQLRGGPPVPRWRIQGPAGRGPPLVPRPAGQDRRAGRLEARSVAGPREARRDHQVGCAEGPRGRAGPQGLPACPGLDRRSVQPRTAARSVRLLDHAPRGDDRDRRRPQGPLRAQGPPGHRAVGNGGPRARQLCG